MTDDQISHAWNEPEGVNPRGTVVVLPGRGEHPGAYERFGRRVAADAYRVRIAADSGQAAKLLLDEASIAPRVLVGADTGALHAAALAAQGAPGLDAVVLAGLPTGPAARAATPEEPVDREEDLVLRSACPTYHGLLDRAGYRPGALAEPVPEELLAAADLGAIAVPVLALHGTEDAVSPLDEVRRAYAGLPGVELVSLADTRHDVLNDTSHRTAAATLVLFLERLRLSPELPEIARAEQPGGTHGGAA
ncbi:lysophospholipase [Streptomyces sp. NBS 14/10]|uniref:alpha/beta hydrolase n=1 Tax=Streptomyces sp. NBS 14/10 TaxID=1945643 RepID=UPI000B7CFA00|nr:lysophospholipase [Streptomyces sp. NBS 14/10]KAK1185235.1 lysophospholipase [Streptomyces sp. NBS 14/10]